MKDIYEELKELTSIPAVSGHEDTIIGLLQQRLAPLADHTEIDRVGNLTATFEGRSDDEPSLVVFAHVDEVGMVVRKIDENGFIRIERIGGVYEKALPGQFLDVHAIDGSGYITGVVGTKSHHLTSPEEKYIVPPRLEMYVDVGCSSREEVMAQGIDIGSIITYHPHFLKNGSHRISSKSIDNRVGVYLLLRLAEFLSGNRPNGKVHVVMSVQEEFNVRGVLPVFEKLRPNASICLDITPACDTPDLNMLYDIALGKGPAITLMNTYGKGPIGGLMPNPKLTRYLQNTAKKLGIDIQREVISGVITDDSFSVLTGSEGVAMAHLSVPLRYTHSPIETVDVRDIEYAAVLLNAAVAGFDKELDLRRGV